jgi:hypothetical protein
MPNRGRALMTERNVRQGDVLVLEDAYVVSNTESGM